MSVEVTEKKHRAFGANKIKKNSKPEKKVEIQLSGHNYKAPLIYRADKAQFQVVFLRISGTVKPRQVGPKLQHQKRPIVDLPL